MILEWRERRRPAKLSRGGRVDRRRPRRTPAMRRSERPMIPAKVPPRALARLSLAGTPGGTGMILSLVVLKVLLLLMVGHMGTQKDNMSINC